MKGKICIVTGANTGIGYETAKALAEKGAKVVMLCRNIEKATVAQNAIQEDVQGAVIDVIQVDFSSQESIKKAANECLSRYSKVDVLVNNAGAVFSSFELTEDGVEKTFAVNHIGYFLLTGLLLPLLKKAAQGRVVCVASGAHEKADLDIGQINSSGNYFVFKRYSNSKLANILFTYALSKKLAKTNITVNCLHPGVVRTQIGNKTNNSFFGWVWSLFSFFGKNPKHGAATSIYLASSEDVSSVSGKYFDNGAEKKSSSASYDVDLQNRMWTWTEEQTNFIYEA